MLRYIYLFLLAFMTISHAKELTIITPPADDGHAVNARILAKYLQKHSSDITSVTFKAMTGAGGIVAANYIYNIAPKDGWTIGTLFKKIPLVGAVGGDNIKFDPTKFVWLGSAVDGRKDAVLLISNRKPNDDPLIIGFDSPAAAEPMRFISAALGSNVKVVTGYKSPNEVKMALERNEIDALVNSLVGLKTSSPGLLSSNQISVLLQFGNGMHRHLEFPVVPTLAESLHDAHLLESLKVAEMQYLLVRPFVAPPGIPLDREIELRKAFASAVNDPEYVAEAKAVGIDANLISWQDSEDAVKLLANSPREILDQFR